MRRRVTRPPRRATKRWLRGVSDFPYAHLFEGVSEPAGVCRAGRRRGRAESDEPPDLPGGAGLAAPDFLGGSVGEHGAVGQEGQRAPGGPFAVVQAEGAVEDPDVAGHADGRAGHRIGERDHPAQAVRRCVSQDAAYEPALCVGGYLVEQHHSGQLCAGAVGERRQRLGDDPRVHRFAEHGDADEVVSLEHPVCQPAGWVRAGVVVLQYECLGDLLRDRQDGVAALVKAAFAGVPPGRDSFGSAQAPPGVVERGLDREYVEHLRTSFRSWTGCPCGGGGRGGAVGFGVAPVRALDAPQPDPGAAAPGWPVPGLPSAGGRRLR